MVAIKAVVDGSHFLSQAVTGIVVNDIICGENTGNSTSLSMLTEREIVVLTKMVEGSTAKEIGKCLKVESTTIATYQQRLRRKLGISHIVDLTKFAIREGLIPLDSKIISTAVRSPKLN